MKKTKQPLPLRIKRELAFAAFGSGMGIGITGIAAVIIKDFPLLAASIGYLIVGIGSMVYILRHKTAEEISDKENKEE